jgi:Subtilase family/PatG C-terminal/PatG Domain
LAYRCDVSAGFTGARESVNFGSPEVAIAVIDGPYDAAGLSKVLARPPISLGNGVCEPGRDSACEHGTFIIGLLGARRDAPIPGFCADCTLFHIPLFSDDDRNEVEVPELAAAIERAVEAGARLINLSLAVLGNDNDFDAALGSVLDRAYTAGVLIVTAAGNQGQLLGSQLVLHPATIPVVAADAQGRILPFSNLSPEMARRGVAAFGSNVLGYAAGGRMTRMSGTSASTAVATGILATIFGSRPNVTVSDMRAAIASLGPRDGTVPPLLDYAGINAALDAIEHAKRNTMQQTHLPVRAERHPNFWGSRLQVNSDIESANCTKPPVATKQPSLALAGGTAECGCDAPRGVCTCPGNQVTSSGFVYAIGTVEADYPNVAIEREMWVMGHDMVKKGELDEDMPTKPNEERIWQHKVMSKDRQKTRWLARQLSWRLTIEDFPVFVLKPQDPSDLDSLIDCLERSKYPEEESGKTKRATRTRQATRRKQGSKNEETISVGLPYGPPEDLDVVIGVRGASTPDGIEILVDQIFTIRPKLLIPRRGLPFPQLSDNYGLTDADRAYNYLAARYEIEDEYLNEIEEFGLVGVSVISSRLSGDTGRVVKVIFTLRGTNRPIERKYFVRVDLTHKFPVLVSPWQPYLERGEPS